VNDFKKINQKEYSIKLVNIEILNLKSNESTNGSSRSQDENEKLSSHRFWHYEIQDLKIFKRHQSPEKVLNQQWTTDNDGEELVPKVYKTRSDMSYMKANFEFIDSREKLAKTLPIIMKMKEIAFLFEPSYPPENIRFVNISNGKSTFLIDLLYQPNSMIHLKKIFESEDRLKLTTNVQDVDLALTYHNISLKKFMDVEMFDLAVERTISKKSNGNFFRGYVQLGHSCLNQNIPPPISIQDLEKCSNPNSSPMAKQKMENMLNNMALRVQNIRPLYQYLDKKIKENAFHYSQILSKSLANKDRQVQSINRIQLSRFQLPPELHLTD